MSVNIAIRLIDINKQKCIIYALKYAKNKQISNNNHQVGNNAYVLIQ